MDQIQTTIDSYKNERNKLKTSICYSGKNRTISYFLLTHMTALHANGFKEDSLHIENELKQITLEYIALEKIRMIGENLLSQIKTCLELPKNSFLSEQNEFLKKISIHKAESETIQKSLNKLNLKLSNILNNIFYNIKWIKNGTSILEKLPSLQYSYLNEAIHEYNGIQPEIHENLEQPIFEIETKDFSLLNSISYSDQFQHILNLYPQEIYIYKCCILFLGTDRASIDQDVEEIKALHSLNATIDIQKFEERLISKILNYKNILKSKEQGTSFLSLIQHTIDVCAKPIIDKQTLQTLKKMNISCEKAEISSEALSYAIRELTKRKLQIQSFLKTISEFIPKLEKSLDNACYQLKYIKNETSFLDYLPSRGYYLKQKVLITENQNLRNSIKLELANTQHLENENFRFELPILNIEHAIWILNNEKSEFINHQNEPEVKVDNRLHAAQPAKSEGVNESKTNENPSASKSELNKSKILDKNTPKNGGKLPQKKR